MESFRTPGIVGPAAGSNKAEMFFANPLLLLGLVAVVIPPVVHFFSRRRCDEVDWGAMQFLRLTPKSRRKVLLDQWLLLAMRMTALGLLAAALAGPSIRSSFFNRFDTHAPRTTVILIDTSGSMAVKAGGRTATDAAREWANRFFDQMRPGDRVALFAVKGDLLPLVATPTAEAEQARAALELLPAPSGTADWPSVVESAASLLGATDGAEILILTDGQRFGWADASTLSRWDALTRRVTLPRTWVANVVPDRGSSTGATITSFHSNRAIATAGSELRFAGSTTGGGANRPQLRLAVDGRPAGEIATTAESTFAFTRSFPVGSHLVSVSLGESEQRDLALDVVPPHGVLVVDGGTSGPLRSALAPANDPAPAFVVRSVPPAEFTPAALVESVRVLVLANVSKLTAEQDRAVETFAADGGGVLVTLGERTDAAAWNRLSHRGGRGWLPAAVLDQPATGEAKPRMTALEHPALRLFREPRPGGLQTATFPQYWRLKPDANAVLNLTNGDPLIAEKVVGRGRVVVCAVPIDASWETNLIRLPDYVPLVHELAHYLAAGWYSDANVEAGEPLVFRPRTAEPPGAITVAQPAGPARVVPVKAWPASFDATREPGPYRITSAAGQVRNYVVRADPREADLTPWSEAEHERVVASLGPVEVVTTVEELARRRGLGPKTLDIGDALLVLVLALFAAELWYTRLSASDTGGG